MTDPQEVSAELTRLRVEISQLMDMKQRVVSIQDKLTYISNELTRIKSGVPDTVLDAVAKVAAKNNASITVAIYPHEPEHEQE